MSLSKYFKDSSSFKREDIVKSPSKNAEGWSKDPQSPVAPFEPEKVTETEESVHHGTISQAHKVEPPTSETSVQPPPPTPPPTPSIDLSKYVLIEEAEKKAQTLYQQGLQDGLLKAADDFESATNAFVSSCQQLDSIRETIISNSSTEFLNFTLLLAEKILRISIIEQDVTIVATIEEALQRAVKSEEFTIFINPDDYDNISNKSEDIIAGVTGLTNIVLKADPTIEKGGAKIESENCIIDATVSSQFQSIREELFPDKNL